MSCLFVSISINACICYAHWSGILRIRKSCGVIRLDGCMENRAGVANENCENRHVDNSGEDGSC